MITFQYFFESTWLILERPLLTYLNQPQVPVSAWGHPRLPQQIQGLARLDRLHVQD